VAMLHVVHPNLETATKIALDSQSISEQWQELIKFLLLNSFNVCNSPESWKTVTAALSRSGVSYQQNI
jgi:hypothetical protein